LSPSARADKIFYYTNLKGAIQKVDVTTGTNVAVLSGLSGPDSLIFSDPNTLVFTEVSTGQLQSAPVSGGPVTTLISSGLIAPQDLALDPSGATVLVSDTGNRRIRRESLSGGSPTTLATFSFGLGPTGVTYDASRHLFVVKGSTIEQLNPTTGAVVKSLGLPVPPTGGDGLAYDPVSKALWVATIGGVIKVDTGLTTATLFSCPVGSACFNDRIDGLESGGDGNIYLANTGAAFIDAYNITGNTFSSVVSAPNIDDLAPVIGSGSPMPTPEPGTFITLGTGLLGLWGVVRRKLTS